MQQRLWLVIGVAVGLWLGPVGASAQQTRGRGDVSLGVFGVDFVRANREVSGVEVEAKEVGFGYPQVQLGGAYGVHDLVMIGAETGLSWSSLRLEGLDPVNVTAFTLTPTVDVFLKGGGDRTRERGARPFLGAALGFAYESFQDGAGDTVRSPQGVFLARIGVRGFISRRVSVDPLALIGGRVGTLRGSLDGKVKTLVFQAGFALTFWMGEPEPLPF